MVDISFAQAAKAYASKPTPEKVDFTATRSTGADKFAEMVSSAGQTAVANLQAGEKATMQAAAGKADLTDVVTAVTQAEVTLQTVMSIRDTLVESYKSIMQMPI